MSHLLGEHCSKKSKIYVCKKVKLGKGLYQLLEKSLFAKTFSVILDYVSIFAAVLIAEPITDCLF